MPALRRVANKRAARENVLHESTSRGCSPEPERLGDYLANVQVHEPVHGAAPYQVVMHARLATVRLQLFVGRAAVVFREAAERIGQHCHRAAGLARAAQNAFLRTRPPVDREVTGSGARAALAPSTELGTQGHESSGGKANAFNRGQSIESLTGQNYVQLT